MLFRNELEVKGVVIEAVDSVPTFCNVFRNIFSRSTAELLRWMAHLFICSSQYRPHATAAGMCTTATADGDFLTPWVSIEVLVG